MIKLTGTIRFDDYMTVSEAMDVLKVSKQALSNAFKAGRLRGLQIERTVLLERKSVEEYRHTRRVVPARKKKPSSL